MVEKLSSKDPISLARVHRGSYYLTSGRLKGNRKCRKLKVMKNRRKRSRESGRTTTQHVMTMETTMRRKNHDLSQCAMCKRWMWQHRTDYEECNTTRTLTCSCCASCWLCGSWFFTLSLLSDASTSSKMVLFVNCSFTTQTQHQAQSSFLLDVVVRLCPVIVHSICIPNSCIFLISKTGLLRCCLYTPRRLQ